MRAWVGVVLAAVLVAGCNTKEKKEAAQRQASVDSMAALRAKGGVYDLSNPEMGSKYIVRLSEGKIELVGDTSIIKGQVTFAVENKGKQPHELTVKGPSGTWQSGQIPPGANILMSMVLDKLGKHEVYTSTKTGKEEGMDTVITVRYQ